MQEGLKFCCIWQEKIKLAKKNILRGEFYTSLFFYFLQRSNVVSFYICFFINCNIYTCENSLYLETHKFTKIVTVLRSQNQISKKKQIYTHKSVVILYEKEKNIEIQLSHYTHTLVCCSLFFLDTYCN